MTLAAELDANPRLYDFFRKEQDADRFARDDHARRVAANRGNLHGWSGPGPAPTPRTDAEKLEAAKAALARQIAFDSSPEGKFVGAIVDIEAQIIEMRAFLESARSARNRSWEAEGARCYADMSKVQMCARRIVELAIDAQVEVDIANGTREAQ
jgi:hypothetical protein